MGVKKLAYEADISGLKEGDIIKVDLQERGFNGLLYVLGREPNFLSNINKAEDIGFFGINENGQRIVYYIYSEALGVSDGKLVQKRPFNLFDFSNIKVSKKSEQMYKKAEEAILSARGEKKQ